MARKGKNEGLSLAYRIGYGVKYVGWHLFGPAQLTEADDPHMRMRRQRAAKVEAAKAARLSR